jgi:ankyrin repeat protein
MSQPSSLSLAAAKLLDPWGQLFRSPDINGCTALHVAVCSGCSVAAISALVSLAKDTLNEKDNQGRSALHVACGELQLSSIKALLSMGADLLAKDGCGQLAAHVAVAACSLQQAQHTDPNVCAGLQQRCLDVIKCLFEHCQNAVLPAASVAASATALMSESASAGDPLIVAAARSGLHDVVAYLLDMDPSCVRLKGRRGDSVLDLYLTTKSSRGLGLLQQRGLMSAMNYASAPRRNAGFNPAHTLKPFWHARQ